MTQPNLKCYWTYDSQMEHQDIVFAESRAAAIYASEAYQEGEDWIDIRAKRMPQFDQYAETGVPKQALLENGWWFECYGWGCDRRLTIDEKPLIRDNHCYCDDNCANRKRGERKAV